MGYRAVLCARPVVTGMMDGIIRQLEEEKAEREARRQAWEAKRNFYQRPAWRRLRYEVLRERGNACECCGRSPPVVTVDVDHIQPRSKYPELALLKSNMQILCRDCNFGKSNRDNTDWRQT
jgi:5-methylcytosine-specific restriction endonuclease McrA